MTRLRTAPKGHQYMRLGWEPHLRDIHTCDCASNDRKRYEKENVRISHLFNLNNTVKYSSIGTMVYYNIKLTTIYFTLIITLHYISSCHCYNGNNNDHCYQGNDSDYCYHGYDCCHCYQAVGQNVSNHTAC